MRLIMPRMAKTSVFSIFRWMPAAAALALVAGCETAPTPKVAQAPPPAVAPASPYQWSEGDAPRAYQDAVAEFGPINLKPGQYLWAATIPEAKDTRIVVDLLAQLFYVYRGEHLVGVATISSGKKGKETPLGFWSVMLKK
jgi:hypothetical protein